MTALLQNLPPPLKLDEELALFRRVRAGDRAARAEAVRRNVRLVLVIAHSLRNLAPQNQEDMQAEGMIGLVIAVDKFDPDHGAKFATYATYWIRALIMKYCVDNARLVRVGRTVAERGIFWNREGDAKALAEKYRTTEAKVAVTLERLGVSEWSIDVPLTHGPNEVTLQDFLPGSALGRPDVALERARSAEAAARLCRDFAATLADREREVWAAVAAGALHGFRAELARKHGISRERVRQIEVKLLARFGKWVRRQGVRRDDVIGAAA